MRYYIEVRFFGVAENSQEKDTDLHALRDILGTKPKLKLINFKRLVQEFIKRLKANNTIYQ